MLERISIGSLLRRKRIKAKSIGNNAPVYAVTNSNGFVLSNSLHDFSIFSDDTSNYLVVDKNDFAYNPSRLNIGSIAYFKNDGKGLVSPMYVVFHADEEKILPEYLFIVIKSRAVRNKIDALKEVGARFRFDFNRWDLIQIPVPSLSEQTRIVGILDTFTASIENLKQQIAQRRKQYEHYRDQLLDLEGKEGVEMKTLGDLCDYVDYRGKTPHKVEKGVFLVTAKNIRKGFIDYCNSKEYIAEEDYANVMRRGLPKIGDVLITTEAPCGNVAQIDNENVALAQRVIKYRPRDLSLNPSYLKFILLGEYFQTKLDKEATGGTVKGIKGSKLHKMTIPVPSFPEQQRIVSILDTFEASIANLEQQLAQRERQYEYYRNKLLTFE